jgi:ribonuclease HI
MAEERTIAYTDGSCIGNPGPGGWAAHLELPDGRVLEIGGAELETTNNRMELRAAIEAVRVSGAAPLTVITDSSYVRNGVTRWLAGWKRNGWRTAVGTPVENQALWLELDALAGERVAWEWTRGHVGTPGNERADAIARWFASSVRRLGPRPGAGPNPASERRGRRGPVGAAYLSLVDGSVARHSTWAECERRVRGVRGARFKKVRDVDEERRVLAGWGLGPDAVEPS